MAAVKGERGGSARTTQMAAVLQGAAVQGGMWYVIHIGSESKAAGSPSWETEARQGWAAAGGTMPQSLKGSDGSAAVL